MFKYSKYHSYHRYKDLEYITIKLKIVVKRTALEYRKENNIPL